MPSFPVPAATVPLASPGSGQLTASSGSKIPGADLGGGLPEGVAFRQVDVFRNGRQADLPGDLVVVGVERLAGYGLGPARVVEHDGVRADVNVRVDQRATADSAGNHDPEAREQTHVVQARRGRAPIMPPEQGIGTADVPGEVLWPVPLAAFEHQHRVSRLGQAQRRDRSAEARSHHYHVVLGAHRVSTFPVAQASAGRCRCWRQPP